MNTSLLSWLSIAIVMISCSTLRESTPKNKLNVSNRASMTSFGIYFTNADSVKVQDVVKLIESKMPGFICISQLPDSLTQDAFIIQRFDPLPDDMTAPDLDYLSFAGQGLTNEEMSALEKANSAIGLTFFSTKENIVEKQRAITSLIGAAVQRQGNFVGDFNTRRYYSASSWKSQRVDRFTGNFMLHEITLHTYREGEFCRIVSLGMGKFCLPDISVKDIVCGDQVTHGALVNAVVATWIDDPFIEGDSSLVVDLQAIKDPFFKKDLTSDIKDGAKQKVKLKLKYVEPEEGDNQNRQYKIVFNNDRYSSPQEEQNVVLKDLFGATDDLVRIQHNDAILQANERAKARLPELQKLFIDGLKPGFLLLVKAPFKTDSGGNEWMWVEVTKWNSNAIQGVLQNEPFEVSGLKAGAIVKVNQDDVFDYLLAKPDGTTEGNETGKLIEQQN